MSSARESLGKGATRGQARAEKVGPKIDESKVAALASSRLAQFAQAREVKHSRGRAKSSVSNGRATARAGVAGAQGTLPYLELLQSAFGPNHDLSSVSSAVGGAAKLACSDLCAQGYAMGESIAFAQQPSLWVAAHEAAHVVQQRTGEAKNGARSRQANEQHANQVADRVVSGEPVHGLLPSASQSMAQDAEAAVQFLQEGEQEGGERDEEAEAAATEAAAAEAEKKQQEEEQKQRVDELKTTLSQFDSRFMDTKDHIGLMGSWLATLVEVSVLTPDAPEAVLGRISSMCTAAFAQWLKQKDDERVGSRQSLEDAVHSVDFKGLAQEQGFSKDFAALAVKALAEFRKSLFKAGSGGRRGAQAWGATLLRQLASA